MATRQPYDREQYVRHTEVDIDEQPTQAIRRRGRVIEPRPSDDYVVEEEVVGYQTAHPHEEVNAVSEHVAIDHVVARRSLLDRITNAVWLVVGLFEVALGLRVAFRLLEANESSSFVRFIYALTDPFVVPFSGIFNDPATDGAVLDTGALMAMIVYAVLTWAALRLMWIVFDYPETGASRSVHERHHDHI